MFALRRGLALVLGQDNSLPRLHDELEASSVPLTYAQCRACPDPCDEGEQLVIGCHCASYLIS